MEENKGGCVVVGNSGIRCRKIVSAFNLIDFDLIILNDFIQDRFEILAGGTGFRGYEQSEILFFLDELSQFIRGNNLRGKYKVFGINVEAFAGITRKEGKRKQHTQEQG